ncbi:MAG: beta-lactamase family protein [Clostridia bacterium]|nr:beta-lactamase family protein [Clostridia bacterium]
MPSGVLKNLVYRAALPLRAPSPKGHMRHRTDGQPLRTPGRYERLLCRHHVLGASLLLKDGGVSCAVYTSLDGSWARQADESTLFRVASITKMATAITVLRLCEAGRFALDDLVAPLLPSGKDLEGITLRHLLSHTSGLRDVTLSEASLRSGVPYPDVLRQPGCREGRPGERFCYCNFGFGLLGCVIEQATGQPVSRAMEELVLRPLGMRGSLDASTLEEERIMPVTRVLTRRPAPDVRVTPLGRIPLDSPDPLRHYGHTAGALYTDAASLSVLLSMLAAGGVTESGERFLSEQTVREMTGTQAEYGRISPTLSYGLGLLIIRDPSLSGGRILGHQGFAYGCVDGAFCEEETGRRVVFLNGGCSEARIGRLGLCNRDLLRWAFREEMPRWK